MELFDLFFLAILLLTATLYSSIGHGGASGYLALMALFSFEATIMKGSALILNIFVSGIAFYQFYRNGHFRWKLFWPFAIASFPMAFLGGSLILEPTLYKRLLAICLVFAILSILNIFGKRNNKDLSEIIPSTRDHWAGRKNAFIPAILIGLSLGFFSGLIGIGGGIILSPVLLLMHWANMKETAAVSALFIFVNSVSGLMGLSITGIQYYPQIYVWVAVALVGGIIGAYSGAKKLDNTVLKYILAGVLLIASIKLIIY